jgi:hypothetical protein
MAKYPEISAIHEGRRQSVSRKSALKIRNATEDTISYIPTLEPSVRETHPFWKYPAAGSAPPGLAVDGVALGRARHLCLVSQP